MATIDYLVETLRVAAINNRKIKRLEISPTVARKLCLELSKNPAAYFGHSLVYLADVSFEALYADFQRGPNALCGYWLVENKSLISPTHIVEA